MALVQRTDVLAVESSFPKRRLSQIDSKKGCMNGWAKNDDFHVVHDSAGGLDSLARRIMNNADNTGEYLNEVKKMTTQIFLLLDMTSSMSRNKEGAMDACNEFIEGLGDNQRLGIQSDAVFTLGVFNSNIGLERVAKEVPVEKAPKIDHEHYQPAGATPLYDAVGQSMDLLESHVGPVMLVIQTDGEENSSQSFTRQDIVKRVAEKTALGWQFVYLGCDIDAMEHGADIGIPAGNTMSYTRLNAKTAFADLASSTAQYLQQGSTSSAKFFPGARSRRKGSTSKGSSSRNTSK